MPDPIDRATRSLSAHAAGDAHAAEELFPLVYSELRTLAGAYLQGERKDHTLQATALVHEAYLRLIHCDRMDWRGRAHFLAMAATTLKRVLIDHARGKGAAKRGRALRIGSWSEVAPGEPESVQAFEVCEALERLTELDERRARVVELRFFGGLTIEETAAVLGVSKDRVKADWRFARAWLKRELGGESLEQGQE